MSMIDTVRGEMMAAMKARDSKRKEVLSELLSALKAKAIDNKAELTPEDELAVISREAKQTKESLDSAPADRTELIEECKFKLEVLSTYLPAQMDEAEIRAAIESVLQSLELSSPTAKDKGKIMKALMPLVKGKADGKQVNNILAGYLG